jgi:hypothetical protein
MEIGVPPWLFKLIFPQLYRDLKQRVKLTGTAKTTRRFGLSFMGTEVIITGEAEKAEKNDR